MFYILPFGPSVLWLICSELNAASAIQILSEYNVTGFLVYGAKQPEIWARYSKCFSDHEAWSLKTAKQVNLAAIANKICELLPGAEFLAYKNPWLAEMLAFLSQGEVKLLKQKNQYNYPKNFILNHSCQEFYLTKSDPDIWPGDCCFFSLGQKDPAIQEPATGFATNDLAVARKFIAKHAVLNKLPIVFNAITSYPACMLKLKNMPKILTGSKVGFIGGRGLGSAHEYQVLAAMAKQCYASIGATRAIVDAGWANESDLIGQGGLMPDWDYAILVGVSGALQHTIGLQLVGTIIAINKDNNAPIFQVADYGLLSSWHDVKDTLIEYLF